jgi:hypothetical protein
MLTEITGPGDAVTYQAYQDQLAQLEIGAKAFYLFHGLDWCGDCPPAVAAFQQLSELQEIPFYSVYVGPKKDWKRESFDDKILANIRDNRFMLWKPKLEGIPTVTLYLGYPGLQLGAIQSVLPDSQDPWDHISFMEEILALGERY